MAKGKRKRSQGRTPLDVSSPYSEPLVNTAGKPIKFGGRTRGRLALPESTAQARETGKSVARREIASGQARIETSQLSRRQRRQATNAKKSLEEFAGKYGTEEQKAFFEGANKAKIRYLFESGAVQAEEVFNYENVADKQGFRMSETPKARAEIQRVIDTYNELYE